MVAVLLWRALLRFVLEIATLQRLLFWGQKHGGGKNETCVRVTWREFWGQNQFTRARFWIVPRPFSSPQIECSQFTTHRTDHSARWLPREATLITLFKRRLSLVICVGERQRKVRQEPLLLARRRPARTHTRTPSRPFRKSKQWRAFGKHMTS